MIFPIQKTIRNQIALCTIINLKWLQKFLALESLELSILALLTRRSNPLSYDDLFITIDCYYSKYYEQPNCSAYNNKFKIASRNFGHKEPRTLNLSNVNTTLKPTELCWLDFNDWLFLFKWLLVTKLLIIILKLLQKKGHREARTLDLSNVSSTL